MLMAIGLSLQYSYASTDEDGEESDNGDTDGRGTEQESQSESDEDSSEETEETTSDTIETVPKPNVKPSDVFPTNQTLVQTLNQSGLSDGISGRYWSSCVQSKNNILQH